MKENKTIKNYLKLSNPIFIILLIVLFSFSIQGLTGFEYLKNNVSGYYPLESNLTLTDLTGKYNGTRIGTGSNYLVSGIIENGLKNTSGTLYYNLTNGSASLVNGISTASGSSFSFTFWIYVTDLSVQKTIYTHSPNQGLTIYIDNTGKLFVQGQTASGTSFSDWRTNSAVPLNNWTLITIIKPNTTDRISSGLTIYFNNISQSGASTLTSAGSTETGGSASNSWLYSPINMTIDEFAFWNKKMLNLTEVNFLYNNGVPLKNTNQYPFDGINSFANVTLNISTTNLTFYSTNISILATINSTGAVLNDSTLNLYTSIVDLNGGNPCHYIVNGTVICSGFSNLTSTRTTITPNVTYNFLLNDFAYKSTVSNINHTFSFGTYTGNYTVLKSNPINILLRNFTHQNSSDFSNYIFEISAFTQSGTTNPLNVYVCNNLTTTISDCYLLNSFLPNSTSIDVHNITSHKGFSFILNGTKINNVYNLTGTGAYILFTTDETASNKGWKISYQNQNTYTDYQNLVLQTTSSDMHVHPLHSSDVFRFFVNGSLNDSNTFNSSVYQVNLGLGNLAPLSVSITSPTINSYTDSFIVSHTESSDPNSDTVKYNAYLFSNNTFFTMKLNYSISEQPFLFVFSSYPIDTQNISKVFIESCDTSGLCSTATSQDLYLQKSTATTSTTPSVVVNIDLEKFAIIFMFCILLIGFFYGLSTGLTLIIIISGGLLGCLSLFLTVYTFSNFGISGLFFVLPTVMGFWVAGNVLFSRK